MDIQVDFEFEDSQEPRMTRAKRCTQKFFREIVACVGLVLIFAFGSIAFKKIFHDQDEIIYRHDHIAQTYQPKLDLIFRFEINRHGARAPYTHMDNLLEGFSVDREMLS